MNITINKTEKDLALELEGRLDTTTAPQLEGCLKENVGDCENLVMDFAQLEYISSAGLRVILAAQKTMNKQGRMVIKNVNATVMDIFEITGFADILTLE